jgi:hypothetical protein
MSRPSASALDGSPVRRPRLPFFRHSPSRALAACALALTLLTSLACDNDSPTAPGSSAIVTFAVGSESFRVRLTTAEQVRAAEAARAGGPAKIPTGRIVAGADVNTGYSWHLEDVTFAEATIELCDGLPSHVEQAGVSFGGGRYCPWSAQILGIGALP